MAILPESPMMVIVPSPRVSLPSQNAPISSAISGRDVPAPAGSFPAKQQLFKTSSPEIANGGGMPAPRTKGGVAPRNVTPRDVAPRTKGQGDRSSPREVGVPRTKGGGWTTRSPTSKSSGPRPWCVPISLFFYLLLSSLELIDTKSLWASNTSPPRNHCTFPPCLWPCDRRRDGRRVSLLSSDPCTVFVYRGTSLIRSCPPRRTVVGPYA